MLIQIPMPIAGLALLDRKNMHRSSQRKMTEGANPLWTKKREVKMLYGAKVIRILSVVNAWAQVILHLIIQKTRAMIMRVDGRIETAEEEASDEERPPLTR